MSTVAIATATLIEALSQLEIDGQYLEAIAEGDPIFILELLRLFIDDNCPYIDTARAAIANHDFARVAVCAHKFKGSGAVLRAHRVLVLAEALEDSIQSRQPEIIDTLLRDLSEFMATLRQMLVQYDLS